MWDPLGGRTHHLFFVFISLQIANSINFTKWRGSWPESIFAPFMFPRFTPFQVIDVWHVEKIKSMPVIKRFRENNSLMEKKKHTRSTIRTHLLPSHNLTTASPSHCATTAATLPPSTGELFLFCPTSPHLNHPQSNFSLHCCRRFKLPTLTWL